MAKATPREPTDERCTIADLVPDPENPRLHPARNIGAIVDSLHETGAHRSIVLDEGNVILAGNGVVEAAGEAGIERVRIIEADGNEIIAVRRRGLTDEQKTKVKLYDNRTGELAAWDPKVLGAQLGALGESVTLQAWNMREREQLAKMAAGPIIPNPEPLADPRLASECFVEIYCRREQLDLFRPVLDEWAAQDGVTVNIS